MHLHEISFNYQARYYKLGEINTATQQVWFVLHGYGQLAQFFIKKFSSLPAHNICVIAPEGLSLFYRENISPGSGRVNDRVGATWMTKENRLMSIRNYTQYLNALYDHEIKNPAIPVTVLGFSQGAATASRWVLDNHISFSKLILWAGLFPSDINFDDGKKCLHNKDVSLVYGTSDPFLNDERFGEMHTLVDKLQVKVREVSFEGGHEIDEATVLKFL
jgi:predicted esterase